jgi:hypothetical protein
MTTNYEFGLFKKGVLVDQTGIDENSVDFAKMLFYDEFGYEEEEGDEVRLLGLGTEEDE